MTPPTVYILDGRLYLEEGAKCSKLLPIEDATRSLRRDWTMFLVGAFLGVVTSVARFVLL